MNDIIDRTDDTLEKLYDGYVDISGKIKIGVDKVERDSLVDVHHSILITHCRCRLG